MSSIHADAESLAREVLAEYAITPRALRALTSGLINTTWQVVTETGEQLILQRLHHSLPPEVNLNLERITRYLAEQDRITPRLLPTPRGQWWVTKAHANWRMLTYIGGMSFATVPDLAHATTAGRMLGDFHTALADYHEPLPCVRAPVHEPARHRQWLTATLTRHTSHRLHDEVTVLTDEIDTARAAISEVATVPLRLVHGDPKLSNLRFGPHASARCLLDLDTLTYAPLAYELGDALRSWCNPQAEDASSATFDLPIFEAALEGYARATQDYLLPTEAASIVSATETIQLELASRFAADALNESYFGWDAARFATRGEHNLRRARNQLACAQLLRQQRALATQIVARVFEPN